jgi:uncharacterized membrane protein YeiH
VDLIDALGIGAFAVVGMDKAMPASFTPWGVILTGLVNALGGAILRDIFLNEVPTILRPSQFYALPVFAGCLLYLTAIHFTILNPTAAAWITVACVFLLRLLTIQFGWKTSPMLSQ